MANRLVTSNKQNEAEQESHADLIDVAFRTPSTKRLSLNISSHNDKTIDFLECMVARSSSNLHNHVRRILLNFKLDDEEGAYGALLDLFITLKDKGRPLRERMLSLAKEHLSNVRYQALLQHLDIGISSIDPMPLSTHSMLSKGLTGTSHLVERINTTVNLQQDPLEEAHECLEYGQVETAQQILEAAILETPESEALHRELLNIYKHTRDKESFLQLQRKLQDADSPFKEEWQQLDTLFAQAV